MSHYGLMLFNSQPTIIPNELAVIFGVTEAILLQKIHYWICHNEQKNQNFQNGFFWTYNTYEDWKKEIPFFSVITIKRAVYKLEEKEILISSKFNQKKYDKTKWYRINYTKMNAIITAQNRTPTYQNDTMDSIKMIRRTYQNDTMDSIKMIRPIPVDTAIDTAIDTHNKKKRINNTPVSNNKIKGTGEMNIGKERKKILELHNFSSDPKNPKTISDTFLQSSTKKIFTASFEKQTELVQKEFESELEKKGNENQKIFYQLHKSFLKFKQKDYDLFDDKLKLTHPDCKNLISILQRKNIESEKFVESYIKFWNERKAKGQNWSPTWGRLKSYLTDYIEINEVKNLKLQECSSQSDKLDKSFDKVEKNKLTKIQWN